HDDQAARFDVAYALADLGDATGRAELSGALGDPERAWDAVSALGTLGKAEDGEALGRALLNKRTPPEATLLAAGTLLKLASGEPHRDAARRVLIAGLSARK